MDEIVLRLEQRESLVRTLSYHSTQQITRTAAGAEVIARTMPELREQLDKGSPPELTERRDFQSISKGDRRYLERTTFEEDLQTPLDSSVFRWNGSRGAAYDTKKKQGRVLKEKMDTESEMLMETGFLELWKKPLSQALKEAAGTARVAAADNGLIKVTFPVMKEIDAVYELDPTKGMVPMKWTLQRPDGTLLKEATASSFTEAEVAGSAVFFPSSYEFTHFVTDDQTQPDGPSQSILIPAIVGRVDIDSIAVNQEVDDAIFEPTFPSDATVYDENLHAFVRVAGSGQVATVNDILDAALVGGEAKPSPAGKAAASTPPSPKAEPPGAKAPQESGKGPFPPALGAALIALLLLLGAVVVGVGSRVLKRTGLQ